MIISSRQKERLHSALLLHWAPLIGYALYTFARLLVLMGARARGGKYCMAAIRTSYHPSAIAFLHRLTSSGVLDLRTLISPAVHRKEIEGRMLVLAEPKVVDGKLKKGVLLIKFTTSFSYFLQVDVWNHVNKYFLFVLEPSWAGYADPDILAFLAAADHCIIQATETRDRALINTLFPDIPALDIGSSNWVDTTTFSSGAMAEKLYDVIYVANLNPIKRVYKALDVFSEIAERDSTFKAMLVCAHWGSSDLGEIKTYLVNKDLQNHVVLTGGIKQSELVTILQKSKVSVLFSLKEGSNRSLFESMFADIPVLCLSENVGVNKAYINDRTGILCSDGCVASCLEYMYAHYDKFDPRAWAMEHISAECSTAKITALIARRYPDIVNTDLQVKVNSPEANYRDHGVSKQKVNAYVLDNTNLSNRDLYVAELARMVRGGANG